MQIEAAIVDNLVKQTDEKRPPCRMTYAACRLTYVFKSGQRESVSDDLRGVSDDLCFRVV